MKAKIFFLLAASAVGSWVFTSCGSDAGKNETTEQPAVDSTATAAPEIRLTPFSTSPEFPDARLGTDYKDGKFAFKISGNYQLKQQTTDAPQKMCANSKDGQHVHVIIDNEPYDAVYETPFEKPIADGAHYILTFLSRSYHESIKTKTAHVAVKGDVKGNTLAKPAPVTEPMVFYSRPKGKYVGTAETGKVMLDFYLVNTDLSPDGNKVKVLVNGSQEFTIDKWQPYFLEGLPMGDNKVKLTLVDKDGNPVNSPLNPVERVFSLLDDPAPGQ